MSLIISDDKSTTLSHARKMACLEAAWELESLARLLPDLVPRDGNGIYLTVRGIAGRLDVLARVFMSGLDDSVVTDAQLERRMLIERDSG